MKNLRLFSQFPLATLGLLLPISSLWAQSQSLGAHVHGEAELLIAIEKQQIEIQLVSPAANILGFEHAPTTDNQWQQISDAEDVLSQASSLFSFQGSSCEPVSAAVEMPFAAEQVDEHDRHEHHVEHKDHDHDRHQHNDSHEHEHEHHHDHEGHSEVLANYQFQCEGGAPKAIQTALLEQFPAIESLKVQWISDNEQGAQTLNQGLSLIDLK